MNPRDQGQETDNLMTQAQYQAHVQARRASGITCSCGIPLATCTTAAGQKDERREVGQKPLRKQKGAQATVAFTGLSEGKEVLPESSVGSPPISSTVLIS